MSLKRLLLPIIISLIILIVPSCKKKTFTGQGVNTPVRISNADEELNNRQVDAVFDRIPIEEKLAQLQSIFLKDLIVDRKLSLNKCREKIPHGIGYLGQFAASIDLKPIELRQAIRDLQQYLRTETVTGIPAIFAEEAITGIAARGATALPQQIGMASTWNPALLRENTAHTAKLMRALGATQALSPMLDICRDARWGRIEESFGEEPYITARMGLSFVKGLQGANLRQGVIATTKHFAGYAGGTDDIRVFHEETLFPHEVVVRLGNAQSAMAGYHKVHGVPCSASKELLTDILRSKWGFNGATVSDFWSVKQVYTRYNYANNNMDAGVKCLKAGLEVEFPFAMSFPYLDSAIQLGRLDQSTLDRAVKRVLMAKARLGLFDDIVEQDSDESLDLDPPVFRQLAYESACQSLVLLKNDEILPLDEGITSIAVVGPNADAVQSLLGDYTYHSLTSYWWKFPTIPEEPKLVTLLEALQNKVGDKVVVKYERGCDWTQSLQNDIGTADTSIGDERSKNIKYASAKNMKVPDADKAIQLAAEGDVIIAAMGENLYLSGENRDRQDPRLPGEQEEFIKKLSKTGKPIILVIFGGRPQIITDIEPLCVGIVQAWYPGEEGGNAVADLLLGNFNPSGKLPVTIPSRSEQCPIWYGQGYNPDDMPLYPFGYGKSYTSYSYSDLKAPSKADTKDDWIPIRFVVKNTGEMSGSEITQLYVKANTSSVKMTPIKLQGFSRVAIDKGQQRTVTCYLSPQQLAYYDKDNRWKIAPGDYDIMIGASSTDIRLSTTIALEGDVVSMGQKDIFFSEVIVD